jgi:hypothetical protein
MTHPAAALSCAGLLSAALLLAPAPGLAQNSAEDLAKQLSNPIASLVSVPLQFNYDRLGPDGETDRYSLNIQPVVPIELNARWNLISRTIVPVLSFDGPGLDESGIGDVVQSFFFSPKEPTAGGWIWGAGPVLLLPTGEKGLSAETFGAGPTAVALRQQGPWTYGGLTNHIESVGSDPETEISLTFVQPFLTYTTPTGSSFTLTTESIYDWEAEAWSVPINAVFTRVFTIGNQPVSAGVGARYWAESPEGGPEGWGVRTVFTLLFPK